MQFILSKNSNGHLVLSVAFYIISSNFTMKPGGKAENPNNIRAGVQTPA
jgi:hypothetical protein